MKRMTAVLLAIAALWAVAPFARAADEDEKENPRLWKPKVTSVSVFKNGLGFFLRQGQAALTDGWCAADAVPPAAFGTLAIFSHGQKETVDIVGSGPGETVEFDGVDAPKSAEAKRARLESCKFLRLSLTYREQETDRTSAGKLVSVGPEYAVLRADGSSLAVPVEAIRKMQVLEKPLRVHVAAEAGKAPAETTLGMAYLRKGITWIPEYTLKLLDEETAELTLRGSLVNEAEDLVHCDVNFVVGVPHFVHTEFLEPLAAGQVIRTIGAAVAPREVMTQIANSAAIASPAAAPRDGRAGESNLVEKPVPAGGRDLKETLGNLPQWESAGADDFTVYTRKDVTLRVGEKAIVTLFVKRIKIGHLYRWSPPGEIAHLLVLRNDTDTPWTTGPCLVTSDGSGLCEDLLKYVPKGGRGELPVTTAINIARDQKEAESDRKLKAYQPTTNVFLDLVTLNGELKIQNLGKAPAEMDVRLSLRGKPLTASDDGTVQQDTANLKIQERTGTIAWRLTLQPGEGKTLTYQYERYVPSN